MMQCQTERCNFTQAYTAFLERRKILKDEDTDERGDDDGF